MQKKDNYNGNGSGGLDGASDGENVLRLANRVFRKVELGLDENEVQQYIEELIDERDLLLKRQEHLSALAELAEKTVIEANNLSQQMKQKAQEQANVEADEIRSKAEKEAERILKEKKEEAKAAAEKEAETIRMEALRQAEALREENLNTVMVEAQDFTHKLQNELLTYLDNVKQHITSLNGQFEKAVSFNFTVDGIAAEKLGEKTVSIPVSEEKPVSFDQIPWLEVEVLPPVDIGKIMDLISRLETLSEVRTTDLLPEMPNPIIRVFLNEPSPLAELLNTLPQVEKVMDLSDSEGTGSIDAVSGERRERIQVILGKDSETQNKEVKKGTVAQSISK